jgi:hypothetical protein
MKTNPERLLKAYYRERFHTPASGTKDSFRAMFFSAAVIVFSCGLIALSFWSGRIKPSVPAMSIADNLRQGEIIDFFSEPLAAVRDYGIGGEK